LQGAWGMGQRAKSFYGSVPSLKYQQIFGQYTYHEVHERCEGQIHNPDFWYLIIKYKLGYYSNK
jgi:hypothetical protein